MLRKDLLLPNLILKNRLRGCILNLSVAIRDCLVKLFRIETLSLFRNSGNHSTPAERLGLEPNTENYKVDRILNIRKIKRSKGIARTEYLVY
ncbi:hypothetical protein L249_1950 [Ophiocordyceps polyrhachis-furcata BCC 54312]|uniref:Uncharacterized protein n=1 Tax=Ophiocordyceps polyrhachis-furcata BCC 54312 TaxID=1330021 RepID=A0A367LNI2_9HYPO|nr:hypothetical protein L249_1950 [Ophiocordyceps polyrhachis-furcata BCC 54312]